MWFVVVGFGSVCVCVQGLHGRNMKTAEGQRLRTGKQLERRAWKSEMMMAKTTHRETQTK